MVRAYLLIVTISLFSSSIFAQSQVTLYQLNSALPQANQVNASFFPNYKFTLGLPVLSSTYISANGGQASFNRIFSGSGDSLQFNPQQLAGYLEKNNRIETSANVQILSLGLRVKKNYFSATLNERVEAGLTYPKSLIEIIGTGSEDFLGQLVAFDKLGMRAMAYHEMSFGYGREITDNLIIGVKAKFLWGIANVEFENLSAALLTSTDSLAIYSSAFQINTSGLDLIKNGDDIFKTATAFNNPGFAIDLGATYWLNKNLRLSLSINDLGSINWQNDTRQFSFKEVNYSVTQTELLTIISEGKDVDLFSQELDSLWQLYQPDTTDGLSYKSQLSPNIYAGGSYHLGRHHTFGIIFYGDIFKGTFKPALGFSYNLRLGNIWTIGVNASLRNNTFNNFGVGTTITLGPIQIFALTENIAAFANYSDARFIDARAGINFVFGNLDKQERRKKYKQEKEAVEKEEESLIVPLLSEPVIEVIKGSDTNELAAGFYVVIATFSEPVEAEEYRGNLIEQGYAVGSGYQSEKGLFYTYLMYFPDAGNKAIDKKNDLGRSFAPGLDKPWVLWVKEGE